MLPCSHGMVIGRPSWKEVKDPKLATCFCQPSSHFPPFLAKGTLICFSVHLRTSVLIPSSGTHPDLRKSLMAIPLLLFVISLEDVRQFWSGSQDRKPLRASKKGFLTCHKEDTNHFCCWILWWGMVVTTCTVIWQLCGELTGAQSQGTKHGRTEGGKNSDPWQRHKDAELNEFRHCPVLPLLMSLLFQPSVVALKYATILWSSSLKEMKSKSPPSMS